MVATTDDNSEIPIRKVGCAVKAFFSASFSRLISYLRFFPIPLKKKKWKIIISYFLSYLSQREKFGDKQNF
jgi:hypothetical protein